MDAQSQSRALVPAHGWPPGIASCNSLCGGIRQLRSVPEVLFNFHWIVPGEAARSAQIPAALLERFVAAHGIKSLINLRGAHPEFGWWRREEKACLHAGGRYFNAMLDSRLLPTRSMLRALWECFVRAREHPPLLIKCAGGQDRTSLAAALYLIVSLSVV